MLIAIEMSCGISFDKGVIKKWYDWGVARPRIYIISIDSQWIERALDIQADRFGFLSSRTKRGIHGFSDLKRKS